MGVRPRPSAPAHVSFPSLKVGRLDEVNGNAASSTSNLHDQLIDRPEVGRNDDFFSLHGINTTTTGMTTSIDTSSEAWRRHCEARHVARKADTAARIEWLDAVERRRGQEARAELEVEVILALPDKPSRHLHLAGVEARLGADYRQRIEAGVRNTWAQRRAGQASAREGVAC